jgi:hypothetical protein
MAAILLELAQPSRAGLRRPKGDSQFDVMTWYVEIELFDRVVHEIPVSDSQADAELCYRRAHHKWQAGEAVALDLGGVRLAWYFAEDVTGLRLRVFEDRAAA